MKYGNMLFRGVETSSDLRGISLMNLGEQAEFLAIDYLYQTMGISQDEIVNIDYWDLESYDGEYLILPINFLFAYLKFFMRDAPVFSRKIIPVFLGMSISDPELSMESVNYLRNYAPIGCRDRYTLRIMDKYQIPAYLFGDITLIQPARKEVANPGKVFFIDAPIALRQYVPEKLLQNAIFLSHMYYGRPEDLYNGDLKSWGRDRIKLYRDEARMIITSRFHATTLGLALGIPTILALDTLIDKYSWIEGITHIYTKDEYVNINWNPEIIDFNDLKNKMLKIAQKRIKETYDKYADIFDVSNHYEVSCQNRSLSIKHNGIFNGFSYADTACDFVKKNWLNTEKIKYSMWGLNGTAEDLYQFIALNYPNAKLVNVYDVQTKEFHGYQSKKPSEILAETEEFIFVTSTQACYTAEYFFETINLNPNKYFLCRDEYIKG